MGSHYDLLGVQPSATAEEIKQAFKRAALLCHPDKAPNDQRDATERFQVLSAAYKELSNPDKRKAYDRQQARADRATGGAGRPAPPLRPPSMEEAWAVVARVLVESVMERMQLPENEKSALLKLCVSLLLPMAAQSWRNGINMGLLVNNLNGFTAVWEKMTPEKKREFESAVVCLARGVPGTGEAPP